MKQQQFQDFELYELPERIGFKFVYAQAISENYAEDLVEELKDE